MAVNGTQHEDSGSDVEKNAPPLNNAPNEDQNLSDQTTEHGTQEIITVSWDGDKDPLCPRSMSTLRKWFIVSIACVGSLCV